jgi:ubiquitin carboxyl-terminal hydrolase 22/27/51
VTPASPKFLRVKEPQPGVPLFGCGMSPELGQPRAFSDDTYLEHLQLLLSSGPADRMKNTINHYKNCLRVIFDNTPIVPQTSKTTKNQPFTSLTPNYLCLQCTTTTTAQDRITHGTETLHRFCKALS